MGRDAERAGVGPRGGIAAGAGGRPWMTFCCCGLILGLFALVWAGAPSGLGMGMLPSTRLSRYGGLDVVRVWGQGEWWRVLSGAWLHGSWVHVLLNAVGLWSVGRWVESAAGPWRMLGVLVVASVLGCLTSLATVEAGMVVGISGGVFGLAGGLLVLRTLGNDVQREVLARVSPWELAFWLALWLVIGGVAPGILGGGALIAQGGHIGGLIGGAAAALAVAIPVSSQTRARWRGLGIGALFLGSGALGWWAWQGADGADVQALIGYRRLEDGAFVEAAEAFGKALVDEPDNPELLNARAYALAEAGVRLDEAAELVARALALGLGDSFEVNALDTQGWIDCRAGRSALGTSRLRSVVELAQARGMDASTFEEHARVCASVGAD